MDKRQTLIDKSIEFLGMFQNATPGPGLEKLLNEQHGPGTETYETLASLARDGVAEGWAASDEVQGRTYRRSRLVDPCAETFNFSITLVYMESDAVFRGDYHAHPYGEINLVIPLTPGAAIAGRNGWCDGGWTAPSPGSHHYPEVKGGAAIALFYLPAGRISYDISAPEDGAEHG